MALIGIDSLTGERIEGWDVVSHALSDALSTPVGEYVLARDYGIAIEGLLDRPANAPFLLDALIACGEAIETIVHLETGEPLVRFDGLAIEGLDAQGHGLIRAQVAWFESGETQTLEVSL